MNRRSLHPFQLELLGVIEELWFGHIEGLHIRGGKPWFDPEPRIVQEVKLSPDDWHAIRRCSEDYTLKGEFVRLFEQFDRLGDRIVDLEIRHSLPFMLSVSRNREELLG